MKLSSPTRAQYSVTEETLDTLDSLWNDPVTHRLWTCPFVSPPWLKSWMHRLGTAVTPFMQAVRDGDTVLGIAALSIDENDRTVSFIGDATVCDYLDFVVAPGREAEFFTGLIPDLRRKRIKALKLESIRADSYALTVLKGLAAQLECRLTVRQQDVALSVLLPDSWEAYLRQLSSKHRHEIRRKLRRMHDAGRIAYHLAEHRPDVEKTMQTFLLHFRTNRPEKAAFMTPGMAVFFRTLASHLSEAGMLRLFSLTIDGVSAAEVLCFDFRSTRYLYNNAYDDHFSPLSVGVMSKVFSLRDGIRSGLKTYDFLKGAEAYKYRLGGKPIPLYSCRIDLD